MNVIKQILGESEIASVLGQAAARIAEQVPHAEELLILGMATRGIPLAERLASQLQETLGVRPVVGQIDPTFYRDDFHFRKKWAAPQLKISGPPLDVEGRHVLLVDDVLYTGRSVRAAIEAVMEFGRPASIRLFVLVDRGHRELPIAPDFSAWNQVIPKHQEVRVSLRELDGIDHVELVEVEEN